MADDPMASEVFIREVGKRRRPPAGEPPAKAARDAMTAMANHRTRAPKGVFIYASHEQANQDWEIWRQEAMRANTLVHDD